MKVGATLLGAGIVLGVALAGNPAAAKCVPSATVGSLEKYEQCKQRHLERYYSLGADGKSDVRRCGPAGFAGTTVVQLCPQGEDGAPQIEMRTLCVGKGPHPEPIVIEGGREVLCWAINPPGASLDPNALVVRSVKK